VFRRNWEDYISANITDPTEQASILAAVDWNLWVMTGGLSPNVPALNFSNADYLEAKALADAYVDG